MKEQRDLFPILFILLASLFFEGCGRLTEISEQRSLMHTYIEIKIADRNSLMAQEVMDEAFQIFADYEKKYNFYDPESIISRINRNKEGEIEISPELSDMISASLSVSEKSRGAFDVTIAPLMRLWDFGAKEPKPPEKGKIEKILPFIDYHRITLNNGKLIMKPGTTIDLSGINKGFAIDAACELLKARGITHGLINAGGNIRAIGKNIKDKPWKIGIQDPRDPDKILAHIYLEDDAVSTSGDYFTFFIRDGVRYHHLLDPHTGYPVKGCAGVTVLSKSAAMADMLSTAAFVLGPEQGKPFLEEMGSEGIFVTESEIETTRRIMSRINILNPEYKVRK